MDVSSSLGSLWIGTVLSLPLWGVNCVQIFWYFYIYERDPLYLKSLVIVLGCLDTANEILMVQGLWTPLIGDWGDPKILADPLSLAEIHHIWTAAVVAAVVQLFFIYRIYALSGNKWPYPLLLSLFCLSQIACMIPVVVRFFTSTDFFGSKSAVSLWISLRACSAILDVVISGSIVFFLVRKGLPAWSRSRRLVFRIILVTISTNMWTSAFAVIDFCLLAVHPHSFMFTIAEHVISTLYFGSLLANLNARQFVRGGGVEDINEFLSSTAESRSSRSGDRYRSRRREQEPEVVILSPMASGSTDAKNDDIESQTGRVKVTTEWTTRSDYQPSDIPGDAEPVAFSRG